MTEKKRHELTDFMQQISAEMALEYARIRKRALEDPGTAGDQGEENWASLLRGWLPAAYRVVTKGRVIGSDGTASPQVDVLVLHPTYPMWLLDKKLYLAGGVVAVFECKITLNARHIKETAQKAVKLRNILPKRQGTPYRELHSAIIYGLLCHSHSWQGVKSYPRFKIDNLLYEAAEKYAAHPRELLDLVCVSDLAFWSTARFATPRQKFGAHVGIYSTFALDNWEPHGSLDRMALEPAPGYTPIGAFLQRLLQRLAWDDHSMRRLASYFWDVKLRNIGAARMLPWPTSLLSDEVMNRLSTPDGLEESWYEAWNEWNQIF
ncbi:MAG: DUF6602 domain-containing protein [Chloroflexia bacterium]